MMHRTLPKHEIEKVTFEINIENLEFEDRGIVIEVEDCPYLEFWVSLGYKLGYMLFTKLSLSGKEYAATQVLQVQSLIPYPLALVQRTLWSRQAAREADQADAAFDLLVEERQKCAS